VKERHSLGALDAGQGRRRVLCLVLLVVTVIAGVLGMLAARDLTRESARSAAFVVPWAVAGVSLIGVFVLAALDIRDLRRHYASERDRILQKMAEDLAQGTRDGSPKREGSDSRLGGAPGQ